MIAISTTSPEESIEVFFSFARYSQRCFTQIYRALYGGAMFVPFGGTQKCGRDVTKTSVVEFTIEMKI